MSPANQISRPGDAAGPFISTIYPGLSLLTSFCVEGNLFPRLPFTLLPGSFSQSQALAQDWGLRKEEARAFVSLAALGSISASDCTFEAADPLESPVSTGWSWLLGSDSPTSSLPFSSPKWINIFLLLIIYAFVSQPSLPQLYHCLLQWFPNISRSSVIFLPLKGGI